MNMICFLYSSAFLAFSYAWLQCKYAALTADANQSSLKVCDCYYFTVMCFLFLFGWRGHNLWNCVNWVFAGILAIGKIFFAIEFIDCYIREVVGVALLQGANVWWSECHFCSTRWI